MLVRLSGNDFWFQPGGAHWMSTICIKWLDKCDVYISNLLASSWFQKLKLDNRPMLAKHVIDSVCDCLSSWTRAQCCHKAQSLHCKLADTRDSMHTVDIVHVWSAWFLASHIRLAGLQVGSLSINVEAQSWFPTLPVVALYHCKQCELAFKGHHKLTLGWKPSMRYQMLQLQLTSPTVLLCIIIIWSTICKQDLVCMDTCPDKDRKQQHGYSGS